MTTNLIGAVVRHYCPGMSPLGTVRAAVGCSDGLRVTLWVETADGRFSALDIADAVVVSADGETTP